jgi:hypothetical protein
LSTQHWSTKIIHKKKQTICIFASAQKLRRFNVCGLDLITVVTRRNADDDVVSIAVDTPGKP